ncbi:aminoglycoside phosphotransferase family protein [Amniculibacterium sp. G2-70]|uniref:aminoglycoside phosphotransferase family protein n=1 Tax=Amniculibacterium sp. G2-70 TaxID=2767188 RepID=UPI001654342C|nr:phosphotransferase [Amniculibacterium sp. G2-70]
MQKEDIIRFFEKSIDQKVLNCTELPASGSARKNFIIQTGQKNFVITYNENREENEAFFYFTEKFSEQNLNTPDVYNISDDRLTYIQTFLGKKTLSDIIAEEGQSDRVELLVQQTLDRLFTLQEKTKFNIDYHKTFEYQAYDSLPILHDLNYFKFMFVDVLELKYHKSKLLMEFQKIASKIENLQPTGIMIRDFQSRNIMVDDKDQVHFIDYQSAMKGPLIYDVVSFLHQAKANFDDDFKQKMFKYYCSKFSQENQELLIASFPCIQFMRFTQVLGAYGFRGLVQRKNHFIESIPQGVINWVHFMETWKDADFFPELVKIQQQLKNLDLPSKIKDLTK